MNKKIKYIEIEAFRGYDSKQVFRLIDRKGQVANLNVLYAPNGFGKTSFMDAVEWGLTGQLTRFPKGSVIFNTADRHAGKILQNFESKSPFGSIQITFEDNAQIIRNTSINRRDRKWDLNPGNLIDSNELLSNTTALGYRIVDTLTQESTDQSVCFTTPEQRFDALKHFWDSNNDTDIYKAILGLNAAAKLHKKEIEKSISKLSKDISTGLRTQGINDILNEQIESLNKVSLYKIDVFSEEISPELLNRKLELLINLNNGVLLEINATNNSLLLVSALDKDLQKYNDNTANLIRLDNELSNLRLNILDIRKLNDALQSIKELRERRSSEIIRISSLNSLSNSIPDFLSANTSIVNSEKNIELIDKQIEDRIEKDRAIISNISKHKKEKADIEKQILVVNSKISKLESSNNSLTTFVFNKKLIEEKLNNANEIIQSLYKTLDSINTEINNLKPLQNATREIVDTIGLTYQNEVNSCLIDVKNKLTVLQNNEHRLKEAEISILRVKDLQSMLIEIVKAGKHFISESNTGTCPLCKTQYNSFEDLITRVESNDQGILNPHEYSSLDYLKLEVSNAQEAYTISLNKLDDIASASVAQYQESLIKTRNGIASHENAQFSAKNELDNINLEVKKLETFFSNENIEPDSSSINSVLSKLIINVTELDIKLEAVVQEINKYDDVLNTSKNEIQLLDNAKQQCEVEVISKRRLPVYNYVLTILKEVNLSIDDIQKLNSLIDVSRSLIDKLSDQIDAEELDINHYLEATQGRDSEEVNLEISDIQSHRAVIAKEVDSYILNWNQVITTPTSRFRISDIAKKYNELNENLSTLNITSNRFADLIKFVESVKNSIEISTQLNDKQNQLSKVVRAISELDAAKEKSITYIENKISKEFNEYLINEIYKKVEPHPTLKEIKFVPELDGDKAKLDIFVKNSSQGNDRSPVVYFSAAQINILSLSIFLAKSLQSDTKLTNTIFMDDPIQFLDSINALSFIDLIRMITSVEGLNQQVFISTHDENFFKLLKRKIDPQYYPSNFMELETFGKLKNA
jgi:DNA repair exonuclease SbcCD ATPase subunit